MDNRGQFSIIAALLVAIILIGTVIVTYSTIRNSPIQGQPQLLSAIDETNFAIKKILGFTVGYYGSVLKITGNTSYARTLAINYLHSGLVNIANMHPQWGASFSVNTSQLGTYWFAKTSHSTGSLGVRYNLTGLGIYGIAYDSSCRLSVQIGDSTSDNQTSLIVTKDEGEPLIDLGREDFKFYKYVYANSTWELVSPSVEPTAFANGTYILEIPSGVDPYSYLIQIGDPRGLIVVASSFSHYSCTLEWDLHEFTQYAVMGSSSEITNAPDGDYATIVQDGTCEVYDYQGGRGSIKKVYFNIDYYGSVSGTLEWYYQLDGGGWNQIEILPEGGSSTSPLARTYNATDLRASWTWDNLNTTDIRFLNNDAGFSENAYVDALYVSVAVDYPGDPSALQDATVVAELLQNGTMRWLGQSLQATTHSKPIPPIPVKAIHVNETMNNVNREVPFQVEDWASNYRVSLGLTNNASVFGSRTMLVFLVNPNVSKVTIWWNGSDKTVQTPYGYANRYFTGDDPDSDTLTNGILTIDIITSGGDFRIRSTLGTSENTARFMRINNEWSIYGADPAYTIHHGIVRDIIQQEAEWSGGAINCPNLYAHIVLTLPANATYYTYQLRLMFVQSQQNRIINDLCPIRVTASTGLPQTENGTTDGYPEISEETGLFYDSSTSSWEHHWSQFVSGTGGSGIMFTDAANQMLYVFDTIAGSKTGAIKVSNSSGRTIELLPVTMDTVEFQHAFDVTWHGAVVTFDDTTPIFKDEDGTKTGLWIITEYPPIITVTTEN